MPKYSQIPNKTVTSISIDREKLEKVHEAGLNLSLFVDEALEREFNPNAKEAFEKAITIQNKKLKDFVENTGQQQNYDQFKYGGKENVVSKDSTQKNREAEISDI